MRRFYYCEKRLTVCVQSVESVALWQFVIATVCLLPKIFLTVFVASRVALLSDGDSRGKMDTGMMAILCNIN